MDTQTGLPQGVLKQTLAALACSLPAAAASLGAIFCLDAFCPSESISGAAIRATASACAFALFYLLCAKRFASFLLEPLTALLRAARKKVRCNP
jgi:hypothetical protein